MKLAIISDVHGNLLALDTALSSIKNEQVDQIICLGDVAGTGAQPDATATRLRQLSCPIVLGNVDAFMFEKPPLPDNADDNTQRYWEIDMWCAEQLSPENIAFIQTFEPTITFQDKTLCFHGSPKSYDDIISPTTSDDDILAYIADASTPILLGGHVHQQILRHIKGYTFINSGSIGLPYQWSLNNEVYNPAHAEYSLITFTDEHFSVEFRQVPYDAAQVREIILGSGMPHAEWFAADWR